MASATMLSSPGKGQKARARGLPGLFHFHAVSSRRRGGCPQLCTLHNDASLDGVTALGILCLTFIGALIFKAHAGDLQGGFRGGPLRGQRAIHFAPLDPGNGAGGGGGGGGGERARGGEPSWACSSRVHRASLYSRALLKCRTRRRGLFFGGGAEGERAQTRLGT